MKTIVATLFILFAIQPAYVAEARQPSEETCFAYAEADVVWETAKKEAERIQKTANKEAHDAYMRTLSDFSRNPGDDQETMFATMKEAKIVYQNSMKELNDARYATYLEIYKDDGGITNDMEDIMTKRLNREREICRHLYGI